MADARNHHYVPQTYLRGFSHGLGRQAKIFAVDLERRKSFPTHVRNVASSRDFNRIEADGLDPNALEKAYGDFENQAGLALRRIASAKSLANFDDLAVVLNLVTLLAVRNPRFRSNMAGFMDRIYRSIGEIIFSDEKRWESTKRQMRASGHEVPADVPFEQMQDFIKRGEFEVVTPTSWHAGMEIDQFDRLLRLIAARKWMLFLAKDDAGDFVTTDHPVCLLPTSDGLVGRPLGFGLQHTVILFPISRKVLMSGSFDGREGTSSELGHFEVALFNSRIIDCARSQVYAADDTFSYLTSEHKLGTGRQILNDPYFRIGR